MTTDQAVPPPSLLTRARQVKAATVADVAATALLSAIGWVIGTLWLVVVIAPMYCAAPVAWGFRAGARREQPDEKPQPKPVQQA